MKYYFERLQGWSEFTGLYREWVAGAAPGSRFVEVGVWRGRSTIAMAEFIRESGRDVQFIAVDHFRGSDEHQEELAATGHDLRELFEHHATAAGVRDLIHLWVMESRVAAEGLADESCDLVYLDASHDLANVRADIGSWWPKVEPGGFLAGHDWSSNWPEVAQAVREFATLQGLPVEELGSTWRIWKPCDYAA